MTKTYAVSVGLKVGDKIVYVGDSVHIKQHSGWDYGDTLTVVEIGDKVIRAVASKGSCKGTIEPFGIRLRKWKKVEEEKVSEPTPHTLQSLSGKYRVTPEESELLQKAWFEAGGEWWFVGQIVQNTNQCFLYLYEYDGRITFGMYQDTFERSDLPEKKVVIHKTISVENVTPVEIEDQKKIRELEEALESHKATMKQMEDKIREMKGV